MIKDEKRYQQEQPMPDSTKLIELWHEDKEKLKEKDFRNDPWRLAYNAFLCGFGRGIAVNKQEQPEVDLEKELKNERAILLYDAFGPMNGEQSLAIRNFARHFYDLGLNTKK